MHGQPPLYNLYIGVVLKAFPGHVRLASLVTQLAFGVALAVGTYLLLNALHVVSGLAAALAICVIVSPPVLLYEWMLFYDYSTLVLVALTAFFFVRMIDCPTFYRAAAFFLGSAHADADDLSPAVAARAAGARARDDARCFTKGSGSRG